MFVAPFVSNSLTPLIAGSPSGGGGGGSPPVNTALPTIAWIGNAWTVTPGTWTGADSVSTVVTLDGNTVGLTGTITAADDGKTLLVSETATNADGTASPVTVSEVVSYEAPTTIAGFYGVGPGLIPSDWRFDTPVTSGAGVTSVPNDGPSGAMFALTAASGAEPVAGANYVELNASSQILTFANSLDLSGVHVFMPIYLFTSTENNNKFPRPLYGSSGDRLIINTTSNWMGAKSDASGHPLTNVRISGAVASFEQWTLIEARYADGSFSIYINGALIGSTTAAAQAFLLDTIGGIRDNNWMRGRIGRTVPLITDGGGEAAIPVIRSELAAEYGITLA